MDAPAWIEAAGVVVTAIFTGVLAVATIRLWSSTKGLHEETQRLAGLAESQATDTKASIEVAKRAADAAELSARAAIGVELPILHIESIKLDPEPPKDEVGLAEWAAQCSPKVTVRNYGRTHAFLISTGVSGEIGKIPKEPEYAALEDRVDSTVIKAGEAYEIAVYQFYADRLFTLDKLRTVVADNRRLYVFGLIRYRDFIGTEHTKGFVARWGGEYRVCSNIESTYPAYAKQE